MPKLNTWRCKICREEVKEIGAYVKLALGQYAHLHCYSSQLNDNAKAQGRADLLREQEETQLRVESERKERETQAAIDEHVRLRNYIQALPRCQGCGKRINDMGVHRTYSQRDIAEVHALDSQVVERGDGARCKNCVEAERIARNDARSAKAPPKATEPEKSEEKPKDRFGVIELD